MCKSNRSGQSATITQSQLELFCSNLPEKYSLLAELMYFSAGRVSEIRTIRVRNLNFTDGMLTIEKSTTKTKTTRQVPIHPNTLQHLKSWISHNQLKDSDFVFFTDSKNTKFRSGEKPVSTQIVDQFFRTAFDWIGIKGGSTHSLRRSRLTHLLKKGWDLREIMIISGHKTLAALQQYLHVDQTETFTKYKNLFEEEVILKP